MAQPAGPLISIVLQRTYDPGATGTARTAVLNLMSRAQQLINAAFDAILATATLTTRRGLSVYQIADIAPDVVRIKTVQSQGRELSRVDFDRLRNISNRWFGRLGDRFETWATLGRQMLVVHPALPHDSTIQVVYTQSIPALVLETEDISLPDDYVPMLLQVTELLLLLKARDLSPVQSLIEDMAKNFGMAKADPTTQSEVKAGVES